MKRGDKLGKNGLIKRNKKEVQQPTKYGESRTGRDAIINALKTETRPFMIKMYNKKLKQLNEGVE